MGLVGVVHPRRIERGDVVGAQDGGGSAGERGVDQDLVLCAGRVLRGAATVAVSLLSGPLAQRLDDQTGHWMRLLR
jgi:hypothetical protein